MKITPQSSQKHIELKDIIPLKTPLVIYTEPSGYCNLKCFFCVQKLDLNGIKKDNMTLELWKKQIDDTLEFSTKPDLLRVCGMGDPLMNPHIVPMMEHAKKQDAYKRIEIVTNGLRLNQHMIQTLPHCVYKIVISLEGLTEADYLQFCGTAITLSKFITILESLYKNKGDCLIHIKIHNKAVPTLDKYEAFIKNWEPLADELFVEQIVPQWPALEAPVFTTEYRWGGGTPQPCKVCPQFFKGIQVLADGEVVACCVDWRRMIVLGNIKYQSLKEIWEGPQIQKLREIHLTGHKKDFYPCKSCSMNEYNEFDNIDELLASN